MKLCLLVLIAATGMSIAVRKPRKLVLSPYVNLDADLSANLVGAENVRQAQTAGVPTGPFGHAPVPAFGLGGMMPSSLGLTNQPLNFMYGQPAINPMSAMSAGLSAQQSSSARLPDTRSNRQLNDDNKPLSLDDIKLNKTLDTNGKFSLFDDPLNPIDPSSYTCPDVQAQAIAISNNIMNEQNSAIYKKVVKYVMMSKYLVAKYDLKLVQTLRQDIYNLMKQHSVITEDQVAKMDSSNRGDTLSFDKEIDEEFGVQDDDLDADSENSNFDAM